MSLSITTSKRQRHEKKLIQGLLKKNWFVYYVCMHNKNKLFTLSLKVEVYTQIFKMSQYYTWRTLEKKIYIYTQVHTWTLAPRLR